MHIKVALERLAKFVQQCPPAGHTCDCTYDQIIKKQAVSPRQNRQEIIAHRRPEIRRRTAVITRILQVPQQRPSQAFSSSKVWNMQF